MTITQKPSVIIALLGILIAASAFGSDSSSRENGRRRHKGPPTEAYCACEGKNAGDMAEFISPRGDTITGTCEMDPKGERLFLRPDNPPDRSSNGRPMRNDRSN